VKILEHTSKLLDPKVDYIFKQIFGQNTPSCNKLLIHLLNSIFEKNGSDKIVSIEYLNPYLDKEYDDDKQSILDIKVKTEKDEIIDIEMQVASSPAYIKRTLWYWASIYEKQLQEGYDYHSLNKCIVVSLLNFNIDKFKNIENYHTAFEIKERYNNLKLTDDLEMHYIELKKMPTIHELENAKNLDNLTKWTLFFNDAPQADKANIIEKLGKESEEIAMAVEILKRVSDDEIQRAKYHSRLKWILERNTIINEAERAKKRLEEAEQKAEIAEHKAEEAEQKAEEAEQKAEQAGKRAKEAEAKLNESIKNLADKFGAETAAATFSLSIEKVREILK
jgi:predicted transposase/invertase (TIGR01784 family)